MAAIRLMENNKAVGTETTQCNIVTMLHCVASVLTALLFSISPIAARVF